jgi:hypothetical protein
LVEVVEVVLNHEALQEALRRLGQFHLRVAVAVAVTIQTVAQRVVPAVAVVAVVRPLATSQEVVELAVKGIPVETLRAFPMVAVGAVLDRLVVECLDPVDLEEMVSPLQLLVRL